jgi:hypothetical protein
MREGPSSVRCAWNLAPEPPNIGAQVQQETHSALEDLRDLAQGIYPKDHRLVFSVADDGVGFDPATSRHGRVCRGSRTDWAHWKERCP